MVRLWTIAMKDLRLLARDRGGLFFAVVFPFLMAIFFGAIFSGGGGGGGGSDGPKGAPIAIVDEDGSARSRALVDALSQASELRVVRERDGHALDRASAAEMVRKGNLTAYLVIPSGFGGADASMFWGEPRALELGVDPSRSAAGSMVEGIVTKYAYQQFGEIFSDPQAMRAEVSKNLALISENPSIDPARRVLLRGMFAGIDDFMADAQRRAETGGEGVAGAGGGGGGFNPVRIDKTLVGVPAETTRRNAYAWTFPQGVMWGVAGCAAAFGISLVSERTKGTLVRLRSAPLSWSQVLGGKGLACFLAIMMVGTALLLVARMVFHVVPTSAPYVAVGLTCTALCFVGIMMLMSVLGRTEAAAAGIGWAVILVMMMVGGAAVPLEVMPVWMQSAASLSPVKWGIRAIEGGLWRGYDSGEMLAPCVILIAVGVLSGVAGVVTFRWLESRSA